MLPHTTHHTPPRKIILLLLIIITPFWSFAQTGDEFYLEAYNKADITPINQSQNGKFIELEFSDPQLNSIFDSFQILHYEEAFEGLALCEVYDLDKIFILKLESAIDINRLTASPLIKKVEFPLKYELAEGLPNDYYIPTFDEANQYESPGDSIRNDYLDLIQAPCAWEITKGDSSILVGVSDSYFSEAHEELQGKFDTILAKGGASGSSDLKYKHGIETSSLIAGNTDNNKGTASVGYKTKLVGRYPYGKAAVKDLMKWNLANDKNLRVINMSYGSTRDKEVEDFPDESHTDAKFYRCLRDQYNIVLVASGGNKSHIAAIKANGEPRFPGGWKNEVNRFRFYPASFESVISVTSVGSRYDRANVDPENTTSNDGLLKDVLWWNGTICCSDNYLGRLNHQILNDKIDIAAPGYDIYRATNDRESSSDPDSESAYAKTGSGTSISAPIVSGTAALMLAVNPDLTAVEVKDILKFTADRIDTIPHNEEYFGQGEDKLSIELGRLNAYRAVKMAKYFDEYGFDFDAMPKKVDLMIRDNVEDIGEEPNETTEIFWNSPDIWVRNQPDGIEEHENAKYNENGQSYVYVRVKNIGCDPSSENDQLKLYWTKAASSMSWPEDYIGGEYLQPGNALKGDTIRTVNIPSIKPGEETILEVPWSNVPNPDDYELINEQPWHFCLLARIESEDDPMTIEETSSIWYNDKQNNNIASKNLTVINLNPESIGQPIGGGFGFPNPLETTEYFDLQLKPDDAETGKAIFNEAEVWVTLDANLIKGWEKGGKQTTDLAHRRDGLFLVTGENAVIENIKLKPGEFGVIQLQFNFLTKKITEKETYLYHAIQRNSVDNKIMGGESYLINKSPRPLFSALTSGDKSIDKEEEVILQAELIGEPASYNWYDEEGNLIYEGADFSTSAEIGKQYKLEVVTLSDGYKDYAEVELTYKPNRIASISPNPTTGQVEVAYKINEGESAYLAITSIENPNISNNYILDLETTDMTFNVSTLSVGVYSVALIVNGQIADTKNLIKE